MSAIRVVIYGMLAALLALAPEAVRAGNTVVVLPIADYSSADSLASARQQSRTISTALVRRLTDKGMAVVASDEVFNTLKNFKCIQQLTYGKDIRPAATTTNLENELNSGWSDWMKEELQAQINAEQKRMTPGLADQDNHLQQPDTTPLDNGQVVAISRQFGADYIFRGRLLTYELNEEHAKPPLRRAILPIFATVAGNELYAVTAASGYDDLDQLMLAGFFVPDKQYRNIARLQLWAQDGTTGAIVWSNIQAVTWKRNQDMGKNAAIDTAATMLINDFWNRVAVDSDGDTVFDHRDRCPGTQPGVAVDRAGCPKDSDGDGVADYLDSCPGTKAGAPVDANGCPTDSDKDGVADYQDACPETPAGVLVDTSGCPRDEDQDGVPDHMDKCANTPTGGPVDQDGCPELLKEKVSQELHIQFDFNKADIKATFHEHLRKVAEFLQAYPETSAEIEGHTDQEGSPAYNLKLSQRRAEAVRQYLVDNFGITPARLTAHGYGKSRPIADGSTEAGRARNRRAVAVFSTTINK